MLADQEVHEIKEQLDGFKEKVKVYIGDIKFIEENKEQINVLMKSVSTITSRSLQAQIEQNLGYQGRLSDLLERATLLQTIDKNVADVFKKFVITTVSNLNWAEHVTLDNFFPKSHLIQPGNPNLASRALAALVNFYKFLGDSIESAERAYDNLNIFNKIKNIDGNIVMVGANGSGKSTFANSLKDRFQTNIKILSAQRFLFYTPEKHINNAAEKAQLVAQYQSASKLSKNGNIVSLVQQDLKNLISAVIAEHTSCAQDFYDRKEERTSYFKRISEIWKELVGTREIVLSNTYLDVEMISDSDNRYPFNDLSDGEKSIFYYIAHILYAPERSYIVIDEPENHLHPSICNRLWDRLEKEREDCSFIYLTHNLDFATSRTNKTILWNKSFIPPSDWDFEILPNCNVLPESLMLQLVGTKTPICFCEGSSSSLDVKLYKLFFPKYTVIPVGGHLNVINYTKACSILDVSGLKAIGVIDGDHYREEQIVAWRKENVYAIAISEVENILFDEELLDESITYFCSDIESKGKYMASFWEKVKENKEKMAFEYVRETINTALKENLFNTKVKYGVDGLISDCKSLTCCEGIEAKYNERIQLLDEIINTKNYNKALRYTNLKGILTGYLSRTIVDGYSDRIFEMLARNLEQVTNLKNKYLPEDIASL